MHMVLTGCREGQELWRHSWYCPMVVLLIKFLEHVSLGQNDLAYWFSKPLDLLVMTQNPLSSPWRGHRPSFSLLWSSDPILTSHAIPSMSVLGHDRKDWIQSMAFVVFYLPTAKSPFNCTIAFIFKCVLFVLFLLLCWTVRSITHIYQLV